MIPPQDVLKLIEPVIKIKRKLIAPKKGKNDNDPLYFSGYSEYVEWKEQISYHTVKGKKPIKMLSIKAPNQSQEDLDYVIANFKQITLPVSFEFITTIGRGLHDGNWSVDFGEENSDFVNAKMTFKEYLDKDIASTPLRMNYDAWMKFVLPSIKINDSMGVVGFKPWREEETVMDNETGDEVVAGDKLPEPIPFYYGSERVLSNMDWGYLLIEANNYSLVDRAGQSVREGLVFEIWDDVNIWIIEQVGKQADWKFEARLYVNHNLGYIPATYLKGIARYNDVGVISYMSPFLMVTDILDEALLDGCNLRSIKASCTYPQKVMLGNECMFTDDQGNKCNNGYIPKLDHSGFYKCSECHGTGQTPRTSPTNTLFVRGGNALDSGDQIKPVDALAYIEPSINTPKFLRDEISQSIMNALSILHLKTTNTVVQPNATDTTATGMVLDEKAKYAFIKSVVDQVFEIYQFGLKCMGELRYGDDYIEPIVQLPLTYDFNSEADYLSQISAAQAAGAPPVVIASYVYKYLKSIFYDNPKTARAYDLIIASDRLFTLTQDQIMAELPRSLIQPWEVVLHDSSLTIIADLVRANDQFLEQDFSVMIEQLKEAAKELTPVPLSATPRLTPQSILADANAT